MASLTDLGGTASLILSEFVSAWGQVDGAAELPDRQYVAPGVDIPWDGPQLTVNLATLDQGKPGVPGGAPVHRLAITFYAIFGILLVREAPALTLEGGAQQMIPDADTINDAGYAAMLDAAAMARAMVAMYAGFRVSLPGETLVLGPIQPLGPAGAMSGLLLRVEMPVR